MNLTQLWNIPINSICVPAPNVDISQFLWGVSDCFLQNVLSNGSIERRCPKHFDNFDQPASQTLKSYESYPFGCV